MIHNTVLAQLRELTATETDAIANLSNAAALLKMHLEAARQPKRERPFWYAMCIFFRDIFLAMQLPAAKS